MPDDPTKENPYLATVNAEVDKTLAQDNMIYRSLYLVVATAIMFGVFGGMVGWLLSIVTPDYFRSRFDALDSEIWQIAVGGGVIQGLIGGVVTGCVVLLATAWYRSRIKAVILGQYRQQGQDD